MTAMPEDSRDLKGVLFLTIGIVLFIAAGLLALSGLWLVALLPLIVGIGSLVFCARLFWMMLMKSMDERERDNEEA